MDAGQIDCIFRVPRAAARLTSYLQVGSPPGATPFFKYAAILFCERPRTRRIQDGAFSASWRLRWFPKWLPKVVLKNRVGRQYGRQLESLHF